MTGQRPMGTSAFILRRFRLLRGDRSGAALIEFAFVSTLLIALLLPVVDLGMGFYIKTQVMTAAQAGVQYAYLHGWDFNPNNQTVQTDICTAVKTGSGLGNTIDCTGAAAPSCDASNTGSDGLICSAKPTVNDTTLSTPAPNFELKCYCIDSTTSQFADVTPGGTWI